MDPLVKKQLEGLGHTVSILPVLLTAGIGMLANKLTGDKQAENANATGRNQYEYEKWRDQTALYEGDKRRALAVGLLEGILGHYGLEGMFSGAEAESDDPLAAGLQEGMFGAALASLGPEERAMLGSRMPTQAPQRGRASSEDGRSEVFAKYLDRSKRPSYPGYNEVKGPGWFESIAGGLYDAWNRPMPALSPGMPTGSGGGGRAATVSVAPGMHSRSGGTTGA